MFGAVPTSIPQIILGANWLLEKNFYNKWLQVKHNKFFWIALGFYAMHLLGMVYTTDINSGLNDLRIKMPLFALPIVLFTTQVLSEKEFKWLFKFFFLSVVVSSVCCFIVYLGYTKKVIVDVRQASVFMSHIRFSLYIAFAIIAMMYYVMSGIKTIYKLILLGSICWLLCFMFEMQMATGFVILLIVSCVLSVVLFFKKLSRFIAVILSGVLLIGIISLLFIAKTSLMMFDEQKGNSANKLLSINANGRSYLQDTIYGLAENGNLIGININYQELNNEWNKRSKHSFDKVTTSGVEIRYCALRYLASKGYTKDSLGISLLTNEDILNIENGITNYKYTNQNGFAKRWSDLVWEYTKYKRNENPSGHTVTMRLEFWKTSLFIIDQNLWFGVGTGDAQLSFDKAYEITKSKLTKDWHLRSHNQYLAIMVAFGIFGFMYFLVYLFYPVVFFRKQLHNLFWPFFLIALISFTTEDTLGTQAGVTFFALYFFMFIWLALKTNAPPDSENAL